MNWIYKKEVNRMGEVTQTLTNESIDMPVLDEYKTPTLIIKKDRFGFGIKFCLGGLDLKGGYKIEKFYTRGCYNTYIEHKRLIDNGIRKYRFRFDEGQVEENNIDYFCKDESEFKIVSDFMFNLKESKKFIVELDTITHGIQYYEFELDGLTELCDEHKIFQYKKPTPFEPYIPTTPVKINFFGWLIVGILFFLSIILIVYVNNREEPVEQPIITNSNEIHFDKMIEYPNWGRVSTAANLLNNIPTENVLINMINKSLSMCYHNGQVDRIYVYQTEKKEQIIVRVSFYRSDYNSNYNSSDDKLFYFNGNTFEFVKEYKN